MQVQPTKNRLDSLSQYSQAGVLGAVGGYALKYAAPLSGNEHTDTFTKTAENELQNQVKKFRAEQIDAILLNEKYNNVMLNKETLEFITENKKAILNLNKEEMLKKMNVLSEVSQNKVSDIFHNIEKQSAKVAEKAKDSLVATAKHARPTFYFMSVGAIVALCYEVLKQSLSPELEFIPSDEKIYF